jgi:hypothetical protein
MTPEEISPHLRRVMRDTRKLYVDSGRWLVTRHKTLLGDRAATFVELMDDLHRGLLVKVYTTVIRSDNRWSRMEKFVGSLLIEHLWDQRLRGSALREAAEGILAQADTLTWSTLVRPFVEFHPLHDRIAMVETVVMRAANLVAKCDGLTTPEESLTLHQLQHEITLALGAKSIGRATRFCRMKFCRASRPRILPANVRRPARSEPERRCRTERITAMSPSATG